MHHLITQTFFLGRYVRRGAAIIPFSVVVAAACADATRITSIATELNPSGATRYGSDALASARIRGLAMAMGGDSSLLWHLEAMDVLRTPTPAVRYEEPTGSEQPVFVAPTYTRATISPYNAALLVETSYKYAYYLELSGQWSLEEMASGRVKGSASYSWEGATPIDWNNQTRHHALETDLKDLPSTCGLTLVGGTTHKISRTEVIAGYDVRIRWSPAEASSATWLRGASVHNAACTSNEKAVGTLLNRPAKRLAGPGPNTTRTYEPPETILSW